MILIQPPVVQNWNSLVNKPSILSDNQISWDEIQNKPTTLTGYGITNGQPLGNELTALQSLADTPGFLKKTGDGTYSIDINSYLSLTGGTITGNLAVNGNILGSAGAGVSLYQVSGLGSTSGDFQVLSSKAGLSGNVITERTWLRRKADGVNWNSVSFHNGIAVDASFNIPGSTTRTWWERDMWAGIQSWGDDTTTYFSVNSTRFNIPLSTQSTSPTTGASVIGGGQGIGGNQYIGGFTSLGGDANHPAIKLIQFSGVTGASQGAVTNIAHNLTLSKIVGIQVFLRIDSSTFIPPGSTEVAGYLYTWSIYISNFNLRLSGSSSSSILSKEFEVLIFYKG